MNKLRVAYKNTTSSAQLAALADKVRRSAEYFGFWLPDWITDQAIADLFQQYQKYLTATLKDERMLAVQAWRDRVVSSLAAAVRAAKTPPVPLTQVSLDGQLIYGEAAVAQHVADLCAQRYALVHDPDEAEKFLLHCADYIRRVPFAWPELEVSELRQLVRAKCNSVGGLDGWAAAEWAVLSMLALSDLIEAPSFAAWACCLWSCACGRPYDTATLRSGKQRGYPRSFTAVSRGRARTPLSARSPSAPPARRRRSNRSEALRSTTPIASTASLGRLASRYLWPLACRRTSRCC